MEKTTFETLTETILSETESYPLANAIAVYAEAREGKSVTGKDMKFLESTNPGCQFSLHKTKNGYWSETSVTAWKTNEYTETRISIRLASTATYVKWPSRKDLQENSSNVCYFKFAAERNEERGNLLDPNGDKLAGLKKVAELIDQLALLHAEIKGTIEAYALGNVEFKVTAILKEKTGNEIKFY